MTDGRKRYQQLSIRLTAAERAELEEVKSRHKDLQWRDLVLRAIRNYKEDENDEANES